MKTGRRKARQDALQILYQLDLNQGLDATKGLVNFESSFSKKQFTDEFTRKIVEGVYTNLSELDERVAKASENWRPDRMAAVDRNILRVGVFELYYCDDIPITVTINEMVELAKQFGSDQSPAFVNGILDRLKQGVDPSGKAP